MRVTLTVIQTIENIGFSIGMYVGTYYFIIDDVMFRSFCLMVISHMFSILLQVMVCV